MGVPLDYLSSHSADDILKIEVCRIYDESLEMGGLFTKKGFDLSLLYIAAYRLATSYSNRGGLI